MDNLKTFTNLNKTDLDIIKQISNTCGILFDTARILYCRKIDTVQKAKRFLNPSKENFNDPFLLNGVEQAVDRLNVAKKLGQTVLVFGDYDADGICATTVLSECLKEYGINTLTAIPEREEGYGLNFDKVMQINAQTLVNLVVTVDCGISDYQVISNLKSQNIDVIVTDHHEPPEVLPDCITINPKIPAQNYPFDGLCGAGVAYKLSYALIGETADKYLDFVALATVADSMELLDENRDIVVEGLKIFTEKNIRPAFKYLLGDADKKVTASMLAYQVAPRVNAGGRMGDANSALQLFSAQTEEQIFNLSAKLNGYNMARQAECDRVYNSAKELINTRKLYKNNVILVRGDDWNAGVIGIVSSRLVEEYRRPVITFALCDGYYKGSARSVDGVNVHDLISSAKELLKTFGGHAQAAGVSVDVDKYDIFYARILENYNRIYKDLVLQDKSEVEWEIFKPVSVRFARELALLEPYGLGNKKPLFSTSVESVKATPLKAGSPHYSFDTLAMQMLNFNGEKDVLSLSLPIKKQVVFEINYSVFRNVQSVKGFVKNVLLDLEDTSNLEPFFKRQQILSLLNNDLGRYAQNIAINQIPFDQKFGVLYVLNNYKNLSKYPCIKNLPIDLFDVNSKGCISRVVICPSSIPDGYEMVVYLDKPICYQKTIAKTYCVENLENNYLITNLSTDRSAFAYVFNTLKAFENVYFGNSVMAYEQLCVENISLDNFIFASEVFFELGFFSLKDGYLKLNADVKSPLTNSLIYSTICNIKENLC